jgi:predicted DNA-binding transcriptional regulator AlpA
VQVVNYCHGVPLELDDLLNATEVAALLGLSKRQAVATYRGRYPDFPSPAIQKGTCVLWLRPEIEEWAARRKAGQ